MEMSIPPTFHYEYYGPVVHTLMPLLVCYKQISGSAQRANLRTDVVRMGRDPISLPPPYVSFLQCAAMLALQELYWLRQFRPSVRLSVCHTPVLCQNDCT